MLFSKIIRKKFDAVLGRYNGEPAFYYFSPKDFPDLKSEPCDITGDHDVTLKGAFYYYGEMSPDRLAVFDHGIGAGHLGYFREIETLAKEGYTVYSYDHTGCAESGGEGIRGFAQGVNDLDCVLRALSEDVRFRGKGVRLIGHSWGGYAVMNAAALHPEVTHVVSLAGFLSAETLTTQYLPKFVRKYESEVMDRERMNNPDYADLDARDSMKKTKAHLLYIQSTDDEKVLYSLGLEPLQAALAGRENTEFVTLENRGHEPHQTDAAVAALKTMTAECEKLHKQKKLSAKEEQDAFRAAQDWHLLTEQDPVIWQKIFDFFRG